MWNSGLLTLFIEYTYQQNSLKTKLICQTSQMYQLNTKIQLLVTPNERTVLFVYSFDHPLTLSTWRKKWQVSRLHLNISKLKVWIHWTSHNNAISLKFTFPYNCRTIDELSACNVIYDSCLHSNCPTHHKSATNTHTHSWISFTHNISNIFQTFHLFVHL